MLYSNYIKRPMDIVFSVFFMLVLVWLFLMLILLYVVTFNFPVFFIQQRIGRNNRIFRMIKFRTLKEREDANRQFLLGSILRFFSFDEIPQLVNVIKGDMSLIGPRPLPIEYLPLYSTIQIKRHDVRPGITGWAQVNGRNSVSWEEKFTLDLEYVQHISFAFDVKILIKTFLLLLSFKKDTSLLEKKFTG